MQGSRLRPFLCVGLAYFVIAVVAPLFLLGVVEDPGSFDNMSGIAWSFAAGATGAIGALGIILRVQLWRETSVRDAAGFWIRTCRQHVL